MDLNFTVQNLDVDRASNRIIRQDHAPHRDAGVDVAASTRGKDRRQTSDALLDFEVQARDTAVDMVGLGAT